MLKFLKWWIKGKPTITYEGYHCGCCGHWVDEEFSIPTYKSYGKWADTWGLCNTCINKGKEIKMGEHKIICGCGKVLVEGPEPTTEGVCEKCREDYIEDLEKGGEKWEMVDGIPKRITETHS